MKHLWILLAILIIGQSADRCDGLQNNLFYGNCAFDNNTMQIYTQVVVMDNVSSPRPPLSPVQRPRKWYDYILHPFQRRKPSSPSSPPSIVGHGNIINTTITYPQIVSIFFISNIIFVVGFKFSILCWDFSVILNLYIY